MAVDTPVEPFGATARGAWGLVPEARLFDGPPEDIPAGTYAVTVAQVEAWVQEVTGFVAMTLTDWQRLNAEPVAPETTSDREQLITAARTVIHNGAASYLEAARHPERARPGDSSYAGVLWERYESGLERLAGWLRTRLDENEAGDTLETAAGPAYTFPLPTFPDAYPLADPLGIGVPSASVRLTGF